MGNITEALNLFLVLVFPEAIILIPCTGKLDKLVNSVNLNPGGIAFMENCV